MCRYICNWVLGGEVKLYLINFPINNFLIINFPIINHLHHQQSTSSIVPTSLAVSILSLHASDTLLVLFSLRYIFILGFLVRIDRDTVKQSSMISAFGI